MTGATFPAPVGEQSPPDRLITPLELALRWGIAPRTVQKRLAAGILPTISFGPRLRRVRLADVEAFEASQREASPGLFGRLPAPPVAPPRAAAAPVVPLRDGATAARPRLFRTDEEAYQAALLKAAELKASPGLPPLRVGPTAARPRAIRAG